VYLKVSLIMEQIANIFDYITTEEASMDMPVHPIDGMDFNFHEHVRTTVLYKNSVYTEESSEDRPFKNITRPMLNLQYRAEGFDVKDIDIYVDNKDKYFMSFLIRKFHETWALENKMDTFIDNLVESYVDFGGALISNINENLRVRKLQSIAFCDQTNLLGGPIGFKDYYSPLDIKDMEKFGWGNPSNGATATIDEVIGLADTYKQQDDDMAQSETSGKNIEIYEVHGQFPDYFLGGDSEDYTQQMHIITLYTDPNGKRQGITLYAGREKEGLFKVILRDEIFGRALGLGGGEELVQSQVWTNYDIIRINQMLDGAAKVIYKTTDDAFANRNKIKDMKNEEVVTLAENTDIGQMDTTPRNITLFENSIRQWEDHARLMASANESILGEQPKSGTPFALQELVTAESHSLHDYRKGKISTFLEEIYRDWVIPKMAKEVVKGKEFMADLSLDELQKVAEEVTNYYTNKFVINEILDGRIPEGVEQFREKFKADFSKDSKKFLKILKDEFNKSPFGVKINIVGKQKYLAGMAYKLSNVFRTVVGNPQVLQDNNMAKLFNEILESSGLSPINFTVNPVQQLQQPQQPQRVEENLVQNPKLVPQTV